MRLTDIVLLCGHHLYGGLTVRKVLGYGTVYNTDYGLEK